MGIDGPGGGGGGLVIGPCTMTIAAFTRGFQLTSGRIGFESGLKVCNRKRVEILM